MINLIPHHTKERNHFALRNIQLLRYTAVLAVTMFSIALITGVSMAKMQSTQTDLEGQIDDQNSKLAAYKSLQAQGQQLSEQISTIDTLLSRQVTFSTLLPDIAKIMPPGAVLKQLDFSTSDILASGTKASNSKKPFEILAAVTDRSVAATLLENVKASKDLFTDADLVDVTQSGDKSADANTTPSISARYPYQVTINAYLKTLNPNKLTGGTR